MPEIVLAPAPGFGHFEPGKRTNIDWNRGFLKAIVHAPKASSLLLQIIIAKLHILCGQRSEDNFIVLSDHT
jgi:hypothetical protein